MICKECKKNCEESDGRSVIVDKKKDGFEWIFLCLQCVHDWRERGLERDGVEPQDIPAILNKEYPFIPV